MPGLPAIQLSRETVSTYLGTLVEEGKVSKLSHNTKEAVIDTAHVVLSLTAEEMGLSDPGDNEPLLRERAGIASEMFLGLYAPWLDSDNPEVYVRFVNDPEFLPALTAVGCLAAALEELRHFQ
jgi:hypothetical protein